MDFGLEPLEQRLLLSADTVVAGGFTAALEEGLAGDPDGGFGDLLYDFVENEELFDNNVPGVRFDQPPGGDANPQVRQTLELDVDQNGNGSISDRLALINFINLSPFIDIAGPNDLAGISAALSQLSSGNEGEEIALTLIDLDSSGRASMAEVFEVLVAGQISDFLLNFPSTKTVADGADEDEDPDVVATTFADLVNGYSDYDGPSHQGFTNFLQNLSEPDVLDAIVDLSTSGVVNNDPDGDEAFSYDVVFNLTLKDDYLIDLGLAAERLEIDLPSRSFVPPGSLMDPPPEAEVLGSMTLPFRFAVTTDGNADFSFGVTDEMEFEVEVNESLEDTSVNVGFLGMEGAAGSVFQLLMPFDVSLVDPSSPVHLGFGQADFAAGGDGEIAFVGGVIEATFAVDAADVILNQDVIFNLAFGTQGEDSPAPVQVTVTAFSTQDNLDGPPADDMAARQNLVDDINLALDATALQGLVTATLSGDLIRLTLVATDAADLGFSSQEKFAAPGSSLTAENGVPIDFTLDDQAFTANVLIALAAAQPKFVNMSFVVSGADPNARRNSFVTQAQAVLDSEFGAGELTVSLDATDHVVLEAVAGGDSLEITRAVTMSAEFDITQEEMEAASFEDLFGATADAVNDYFEIDLTLNAKPGIEVDPVNGLDGENLNITADVIVDTGSAIVFPLQNDRAVDFTGLERFDLGESLSLSGDALEDFLITPNSFQNLLDFNVIGAAEVVNLIGQLKGWLNRLPNSTLLGGVDIPFAEATLGELLDFADLIQDKLLIDDKDNGFEAFDDPDRDDQGRLIDFIDELDEGILSVTFATAQELAARLDALPFVTVAGGVANYDMSSRELTYDIRVETSFGDDPTVVIAPIDFDLDLAPLFDVSVQADVVLAGTVAFEATLGLNLSSSAQVELTTELDELNNGDGVPIRTDLAITGAGDVEKIFGRLAADAVFSVSINGGAPVQVKVTKAATGDNLTTSDLLDDINDALAVADSDPDPGVVSPVDISGQIEAVEIAGRIVLQAVHPSVTKFNVTASNTNSAVTELGLQSSTATTVFLAGAELSDVSSLSGSASFKIEINNDGTEHTVTVDDLSGNNTVNDLVNDLNAALPSELAGKIVVVRSASRLVVAAIDSSVAVFRIEDGSDTAKLGLAAGQLLNVQEGGVFLSQVAGVFLVGANLLDSGVNPDVTTGSAFGRLANNASFDVSLNGDAGVTVTVAKSATLGNKELEDLMDQINDALGAAGLGTKLKAIQVSASQIGLRAISDEVESIEITSSATELGLLAGQVAEATLRVAATKAAPFYFGPRTDAAFTIHSNLFEFDPGTAVDASADAFTLAGHGLQTGDAVVYDNGGGSDIGGLTHGTKYFVIKIDSDVLKLATSTGNAAGGTAIDLTDTGAGSAHSLDRTVALDVDATLSNRFIFDLVNDLNRSLNDTFHGASNNPFVASFDGLRLVVRAKDGSGVTAFQIAAASGDSAVVDLKLHDIGADLGLADQTVAADRADLLVFTQDGAVHRVPLDDDGTLFSKPVAGGGFVAKDLQEVKLAIETATSGDVKVELNAAKTGLVLVDDSGTGTEGLQVFRVDSVNGSRAVYALGIQGSDVLLFLADFDAPVTIESGAVDHKIEGDEVGTLDLEDRLFVRQVDASTPFLTGSVLVFVSLDNDDDEPGEEESASFGFVGVELDTSGFLGILQFDVAFELNKGGDPLNNVTLAELFDAISLDVNGDGVLDVFDLNEVLSFPDLTVNAAADELVFDVALLDGLIPGTISLGANPQLTLHVHDAGNPFHMKPGTASFDGASGAVVDAGADTITLTGHGFVSGDKVTYRNGGGTSIGGLANNKSYYVIAVDDDTIQLAVTKTAQLAENAVDLTGLGTGDAHRLLRFDPVAPEIHVHQSDLGDLANFADIEFGHVLEALEQVRDFLNDFASLEFLDQEIPVLGVSFNDLLDLADRFAAAVHDITNNPAPTIQQLTQKIRESFGLPPGASVIGLSLVDDDDGADGDTKDMLMLTLNFGRAFTEALMVDLDLSDQVPSLPLFGDISLIGRAGLGADVTLNAVLSVGIDLDDDGGADSMGEVFLFTDEADTSIALTLDATSTDIAFNASVGPLGVAIIGGDGNFDLDVEFKNPTASAGDRVSLADIGAAFAEFEPSLTGALLINLPVYFPTPSQFVGDIAFDASLILNGTNQELAINNFEVPSEFLDAGFFENFGILSSLPLAIDALDLLLETVQDVMSGEIFGLSLPFIGDRLADGAEFIEDLRAGVIAPFRNLVENTPKTEEDLADLVQQFLFAVLGPGGAGLGIPELTSLPGLGLLVDPTDGLAATAADFANIDNILDIFVDLSNSRVEWNFELGETYTPDLDFNFDLGFPALGLDVEGGLAVEVTWNFGLGLGISTEDGPFINIDRRDAANNPIPELSLSVDAGVKPNTAIVGRLGFLQLGATSSSADADGNGIDDNNHIHASFTVDLVNGSDPNDARLSFFELGDLEADVDLNAGAELNLDLRLAFNEDLLPDIISAIMPALVANFEFLWEQSATDILDDGFDFDIVEGLQRVAFNDIGLDLGSFLGDFLGPIVAQIQEFTEPLQPIIDILTAPIPVLSDLAGRDISLIDIAASFGEFDPGLIYALADLISFVNSMPASPGSIILPIADEFILVGSGLFGSDDLKGKLADPTFKFANAINPESSSFIGTLADAFDSLPTALDGMFNEAGEFVEGVFAGALGGDAGSAEATATASLFRGDFSSDERGGFDFPFLKNPLSILGALMGNPMVLVTYDLPPLVVEFTWEQSFMIYGPLWGVIGAGLGVRIDLAFGYDTLGIQRFAEGGFSNPLDLLAGLFISDTDMPDGSGTDVPELQLKGEISVGAELNAGVASAGIQAAITLTVNFDLNDPDGDGRVRLDEIAGNFLYEFREGTPALAPLAIFDISGEISFQLRAYLKILFAKFTFEITPPITLFEFAIEFDREPILATERGDGSLLLNIGSNSGARLHGNTDDIAETIEVKEEGGKLKVWSDQFGVPESAAQTYSGNKIVGLGGEFGDTIIIHSSVTVPVFLDGQSGDDVILAQGSGPGELIGGVGDDIITGGSGADIIYGGEGNDTLDGGAGDDLIFGDSGRVSSQLIAVLIREKDGNDVISGGAGHDIIFGGGGEDTIGGDNFVNLADPDDAPSAGNDLIFGDGGRIVFEREGILLPTPEIRSTDSPGGRKDIIHGHGGDDTIYGGAGNDIIDGGAGEDEIHGESGFDHLSGAGGADTIFGGTEDDVIYGFRVSTDPGDPNTDGADYIEGGDGNDFIRGNQGNDILLGGRGTDIIFGDEDADTIDGGSDNDYIFGGAGSDLSIEGGTGNDIVFGDDGLIVFFDFGLLPFASSFVSRPGHEIDANGHRLIGDGTLNPADPFIGNDDGNYRTIDLILTEVNGLTDGDDYIVGGEGDDIVLGGSGGDTIFGDFDPVNPPEGPIPAGEDILIGDGGRIQFYERQRDNIRSIVGTSAAEVGADTISGNGGSDVIFGSGDADFLYGKMAASFNSNPALSEDPSVRDDDIILGDDGEIDYGTGTGIIQTIFTYLDATAIAVGGADHVYGNADDDIIFGGIGGDILQGDGGEDGDDVIFGDNGQIDFALDDDGVRTLIAKLYTTDVSEASGGADIAEGQGGTDVILGGVNNGGIDQLYGDQAIPTAASMLADGQDIILGDNGELIFDLDGDLDTLDRIRSYPDGLGGVDQISGNAGDDVLLGGNAGDIMYGDDAGATSGALDGEDVMLGDNGDILLIGTEGRLIVRGTAIDLITTTDTAENTGGADTLSGNAAADILLGGVNDGGQDTLYGDRSVPINLLDLDDILLGDNGLLDFTFGSDTDRHTLDLIRSFEDGLGGIDVLSGNKGQDVGIGGTDADIIYGDDATASAGANDGGDILIGDNADIFLVAQGGAVGGDLKAVLDAAVMTIRSTDEEHPEYGGADIIFGNAAGDVIIGGVQGDFLYGDRQNPTPATAANEGDDIILGDNGALEWLSDGRLAEVLGIDIEANNPALWAKFGTAMADTDLTTLDLITTEQPTRGGRDTIYGGEGNDLVFGGTDSDTIWGDDGDEVPLTGFLNRDVLFGDHGRLYPQFSVLPDLNSRNFFAIDTGVADGGEGDRIWGEEGDDLILGQQGDDRMWGGSGDDDMIGGHNVSGGYDELIAPAINAVLGAPVNDIMDGGSGNDAMAGDNAIMWRRGDDLSPRFRFLTAAAIYTTTFDTITANIGPDHQSDPDDAVGRDIELLDHSDAVQSNPLGRFGADVMAGGAGSDVLYGELGNDLMQGDGFIGADDLDAGSITHVIEISDAGINPDTDETLYFNVPEQATDADDYMEGNGGDDLMYGGLGQDDIIGGSSGLFGLTDETMRPDGSDVIFGGAGIRIARNDEGDPASLGHSRDADYIMGDNANLFRLVNGSDQFLVFAYDNYAGAKILPRAMEELDYTLGGADYAGGSYANGVANLDNGAADLIHGEDGDDVIFGMVGSDILFGNAQDDDIIGGYGHDWISGGTGQDGVLGDDGLIFTSRNGTAEALYSIAATTQETISTPGKIQIAVINVTGQLKKSVDLVPFSFDPSWNGTDDEFPDNMDAAPFADDIIFGGLGSDFLHGGSGDDAISGAEALEHAYVPVYDANGDPIGVTDLGYLAVGLPGAVNPGHVLAFNAEDTDGQHLNNRLRAGEFRLYDEYNPLSKILLENDGTPATDGTGFEFLLNFDPTEGPELPGGSTSGPQGFTYGPVNTDGDDAIFGDLGNDWLVGGTGRDNLYGGWGNDLLNVDDDHSTNGGLNDQPDTHPSYEDRAYGGAGRDILIANTGGDRLIDWVGEYNSYLVPFAPFGAATVSRTLQPFLPEFLYALSKADGADQSRPADTGADPLRNGEPEGELGLVLQKDSAWQAQTGAPADPQAGNIPGGQRDVLRSADFNNGQAQGFAADTGTWTVASGRYQVAPTVAGGDAVSVFYVDEFVPNYFEMLATINAVKPTGGAEANAYLVFDYQSPTDFKFAGINVSTNKLEIGHRTAQGWVVDKQAVFPGAIKAGTDYNLFLSLNGSAATLVINNQVTLDFTFAPRLDPYGFLHGLNDGMVGLGARNAKASIDNVAVQRLAPITTLHATDDFANGASGLFASPSSGAWTAVDGRYQGMAGPSQPAVSLVDLHVAPASLVDLLATFRTDGEGGFIFDQHGPEDFKFVTLSVATQQIIIGHRTARGWFTDAVFSGPTFAGGVDHQLGLTLKGTTASVTWNGQQVLSYSFHSLVTDGSFGLMSRSGLTSFDAVTVKSDDPRFK